MRDFRPDPLAQKGKDFCITMLIRIRACVTAKFRNLRRFPSDMRAWIKWKWYLLGITFKSLFYNHLLNGSYAMEVLIEPLVWVVDHFAKALGPILVAGVLILTSTIVYIVYWLGLPHYRDNRPYMYVILMTYGHWLLLNVVFHFYMACTTHPGSPMKAGLVVEAVGVCRKCVAPKPPRTHHCSVCNRCVLKMDHHCPWINNCVGHYNHRYFFMYMVFMILGTFFIVLFGAEIAYNEIWLGGSEGPAFRDTVYRWCGHDPNAPHLDDEEAIQGYPVRRNDTHLFKVEDGVVQEGLSIADEEHKAHLRKMASYWLRFAITYAGMLTIGAFMSLGVLATWHGRLISAGETSVEQLINKKERSRLAKLGQVYKNPYDFGRAENWRIFLGIQKGSNRSFFRHILFPSTHSPYGTGLSWATCYDNDEYNSFAMLYNTPADATHQHQNVSRSGALDLRLTNDQESEKGEGSTREAVLVKNGDGVCTVGNSTLGQLQDGVVHLATVDCSRDATGLEDVRGFDGPVLVTAKTASLPTLEKSSHQLMSSVGMESEKRPFSGNRLSPDDKFQKIGPQKRQSSRDRFAAVSDRAQITAEAVSDDVYMDTLRSTHSDHYKAA